MKRHSAAFLLLTISLAASCGASRNSAPIVYGTEPSTNARVYNSPADVYMADNQRVAAAAGQQAGVSNDIYATPNSRPAPLAPVSQSAYNPAPYQNAAPVYQPVNASGYGAPSQSVAPVYVSELKPVGSPSSSWPSTSPVYVTVQPGDTVFAIARRTSVHPRAIIAENRMAAPYTLRVGQSLRIPSGGQAAGFAPAPASAPAQSTYGAPQQQVGTSYIVRPGDTLYSISRRSGVPVSAIARQNGLNAPYRLSVGTQLSIPSGGVASVIPQKTTQSIARSVSYKKPAPSNEPKAMFDWPVKGAIIGSYGAGELGRRNDGINIAAPVGTPIRAAADGEVVYRGAEVDGYGNLLLIKHRDDFVTAYAHTDVILVRKGQKVRQGQVIAKVGQSGAAKEPQLHFEIRQNLKSVDPIALLR